MRPAVRAILLVLFLLLLALDAGCGWRDGRPEDVAACVQRCRESGARFDDLIRDSSTQGSAAKWCVCWFPMPFPAADGGVSR